MPSVVAQSLGCAQERQPLAASVVHVSTAVPWQVVAPGTEQPVPSVDPAAGHWQVPEPSGPRQVSMPGQATGAAAMWQPLGSLPHATWCAASEQNVPTWPAVQVSSHVQVEPSVEPLHDMCDWQATSFAASENGQAPSIWQVDCVPELEQKVPAPVQAAGAGLHAQAPWPAAPWQVECALQAWGEPETVTQPCASATQVVTPPGPQ
jgi:hypothetical protein